MAKKRIQAPAPHLQHAQMQSTPPTTPPPEKDPPPDDDLVPSLPPDWQPPTFLTQDIPTTESEDSEDEEIKDAIIM